MKHQIDYRNGADINTMPDIESELLFGNGRAYGLEILFRKKMETKRMDWLYNFYNEKTIFIEL